MAKGKTKWVKRKKRITFTKFFEQYRDKYGTRAAIRMLEGYYLIPDGNIRRFEKETKEALRKGKKSFTFEIRTKRKRR